MKTIYLDSEFKCHVINDGTMKEIKTYAFDDKCDIFIEGYRFVPYGERWIDSDGVIFDGEMVAPWKSSIELNNAQYEYEKQQLEEYKSIIAEQDLMILDLQYNTLINEE